MSKITTGTGEIERPDGVYSWRVEIADEEPRFFTPVPLEGEGMENQIYFKVLVNAERER